MAQKQIHHLLAKRKADPFETGIVDEIRFPKWDTLSLRGAPPSPTALPGLQPLALVVFEDFVTHRPKGDCAIKSPSLSPSRRSWTQMVNGCLSMFYQRSFQTVKNILSRLSLLHSLRNKAKLTY